MTSTDRSTIKRLLQQARDDPKEVPIEPLVDTLEDGDGSDREQATAALLAVSKREPERVRETIPEVSPLLADDRPTVRNKAITTMVNVGTMHPEALTPYAETVIELLEDDSSLVARDAIRALHHIAVDDPDAVSPALPRLIQLLEAPAESTRLHAVAVVEHLAAERPESVDVSDVAEPLLEILEDPHELPSDVTFDPKMAEGQSTPADQLRGHRMLAMDEKGKSENTRAREKAAATLATVTAADPTAGTDVLDPHMPRLFDLLEDRNPTIRGTIVGVFAYVAEENPEAVRPIEGDLIDCLDEPIGISGNAIWTLGFIGSDRALEALRDVLEDEDVDTDIRTTAETVLESVESSSRAE